MAEESVDDFLKKVTAERKPLSEEERKEAMVVALQVWKIAMEKTNGKNSASLSLDNNDRDSRIYINIENPRHQDSSYNKALLVPNTDLVVGISGSGVGRGREMHQYEFSPGKVTKIVTTNPPPEMHMSKYLGNENTLQQLLVMSEAAKRRNALVTRERYHPDKKDLQSLLSIVSSARESSSPSKVVPLPR
jgi:hypothetical protein